MEKKILSSLSITNFLLSLLIVFHHAFTTDIGYVGTYLPTDYGFNVSVQRFMYNLSECAVPVFYFLSAYLFFRNFDGSFQQYKMKISRRFYSLFVPYVIFCTFGYIKHLIVSGLTGGGILGWMYELWLCETMPLWFIRELMALALLAPLFYWLKGRRIISVVLSTIIIALVIMGYVPYRSFVYWIPVYLIGVNMSADYWDKISEWIKRKSNLVSIILLLYVLACWFLPNGSELTEQTNAVFILFRIVTPVVYIPIIICIAMSNLSNG